jgi:hypothetical protein
MTSRVMVDSTELAHWTSLEPLRRFFAISSIFPALNISLSPVESADIPPSTFLMILLAKFPSAIREITASLIFVFCSFSRGDHFQSLNRSSIMVLAISGAACMSSDSVHEKSSLTSGGVSVDTSSLSMLKAARIFCCFSFGSVMTISEASNIISFLTGQLGFLSETRRSTSSWAFSRSLMVL